MIKLQHDSIDLKKAFNSWVMHLKKTDSFKELILKAASFNLNQKVFYLVPMTTLDLTTDSNVELIKTWREANQFAYPTRFNVTLVGTRRWLENAVYGNDLRMLFWITDSNFAKFGHIGVLMSEDGTSIEVDNVLRGESGNPGLVSSAVRVLENLVQEEFSLEEINLRVLESNHRAVDFYLKLGYKVVDVTPLIESKIGDSTNLIPGTPGIDNFLTMSKSLLDSVNTPTEILTAGPSISTREISYVNSAVSKGWNRNHSDFIAKFENTFAEFVGAKYALATSSCSGALHLALLALDIGPGDEVIVPDITWVATASAVMYTGAKPVFADINTSDWTLNLESLKSLINTRTKAIMPVHLYGYGAAMKQIMAIAKEHNLYVIEDAAPAIGTEIEGKLAGTFGEFGCYSFQGAKLLVTGEGGMLVTDNEYLYNRAKKDQDHGRKPGTFWIDEIGHKYKMNNITAALGLAQIERAHNQIYRKRRINRWYLENLSDVKSIDFQQEARGTQSICWMTSFTLSKKARISRDDLMDFLKKDGIDSRPVFPAISQYPIWKYQPEIQENSKIIGASGINLPSGVQLPKSAIDKVCGAIRKALRE